MVAAGDCIRVPDIVAVVGGADFYFVLGLCVAVSITVGPVEVRDEGGDACRVGEVLCPEACADR